MTIYNCVNTCDNFYFNIDPLLKEKYFADFRPIKINSGHHFHFIYVCKGKYVIRFLSPFIHLINSIQCIFVNTLLQGLMLFVQAIPLLVHVQLW